MDYTLIGFKNTYFSLNDILIHEGSINNAKAQKKSINNMCSVFLKDLRNKILGIFFPNATLQNYNSTGLDITIGNIADRK